MGAGGGGPGWGPEPFPSLPGSPGCTRLLREVMAPQGALVRSSEGSVMQSGQLWLYV